MTNYREIIARQALAVGAVKLATPEKDTLFTWAKGWRTPVYTNNREHLGYHENRVNIVNAMRQRIQELGITFDGILGTSLAGIPWATLLADKVGKPVFIFEKNIAYGFRPIAKEKFPLDMDYDLVAANAPAGIYLGVRIAHASKLPFVYIRDKTKDHGLMKQIEGVYSPGQEVMHVFSSGSLITNERELPEGFNNNRIVLEQAELKIVKTYRLNTLHQVSIAGMKLLIIEDLISTGGSSMDEAIIARNLGAEVTDMITIFNYCFPQAQQVAQEAHITIHNLCTYDTLLPIAVQSGYVNQSQLATLTEWNPDPIGWSDKHGGTSFKQVLDVNVSI